MSTNRQPLDPECSTDDAFLDAIAGLESLGRCLDLLIDDAPARDDTELPAEPWTEPLDALLGLISLRHTLRLLVAAMCTGSADRAPEAGAAWSRELLR